MASKLQCAVSCSYCLDCISGDPLTVDDGKMMTMMMCFLKGSLTANSSKNELIVSCGKWAIMCHFF